jgi:hypothetical protein
MNIHNRLERLARVRRMHRPGEDCPRPIPLPIRLKTAADLLTLLEEQITAVRSEEAAGVLEKARVVGFLASLGLRAIEAGNLEARIEMLEAVLKQRNRDGKQ